MIIAGQDIISHAESRERLESKDAEEENTVRFRESRRS